MRTILVATDGQHLLQITYVRDNFWRRVDGAKRNPPERIAVDSGGNSPASIHPTNASTASRIVTQRDLSWSASQAGLELLGQFD